MIAGVTSQRASQLPAAVLWDMDGTLIDSEPLWDVAIADLAARRGFTMTPEVREETLGNSLYDAMTKVYDAAGTPEFERDRATDERWLLDHVTDLFTDDLPWRPGAQPALDLIAAAGIPMVLVTNTVRELTTVSLQTIGAHRFTASVCGDEVPVGKPEPDIYLRAAELVGANPADCLAVEDSPAGSAAAPAAGCPTLVVPSAVAIGPAPLRSFRDSLVGLTLDDVAAAYGVARPDDCARVATWEDGHS